MWKASGELVNLISTAVQVVPGQSSWLCVTLCASLARICCEVEGEMQHWESLPRKGQNLPTHLGVFVYNSFRFTYRVLECFACMWAIWVPGACREEKTLQLLVDALLKWQWVPGIEPGSSASTPSTLKHWVFFPAPKICGDWKTSLYGFQLGFLVLVGVWFVLVLVVLVLVLVCLWDSESLLLWLAWTYCADEAELGLSLPLPLPPGSWNQRCVPPHHATS